MIAMICCRTRLTSSPPEPISGKIVHVISVISVHYFYGKISIYKFCHTESYKTQEGYYLVEKPIALAPTYAICLLIFKNLIITVHTFKFIWLTCN